MLNRRLLIVGMFAVACGWLPGKITADERNQLPSTYTLDLFQSRPHFNQITATPEQRAPDKFDLHKLMIFTPDSFSSSEQRVPTTFDLHSAGNRTGGVNWDPVALDDLSAPQKVSAQRPSSTEPDENCVTPCGHTCPVCQGTSQDADIETAAQYVPEEPAETRLREGEPAKLLLQTMKQVRPSIIDGTIFQDSRPIDESEAMPLEGEGSAAIIVRCIRSLEAQADRQRVVETSACSGLVPAPAAAAAPEATPEAVSALRQAGRELEMTANMLEERGLYDQADHLRVVAQEMRIEARAAVASDRSVSFLPTPMPGPGSDSDELAGEKRLDERQPKLHYNGEGEGEDQD